MEKSVYSSTQIPHPHPLPNSSLPSADESGWTAYLLDDPSADDAYSLGTSSLLSDAASHAARKTPAAAHPLNIPRKLNLKPNPSQFFADTSLEDTASSPDNSPKVADLGPFDANNNYRRKSSLGNGKRMGEKYNNRTGEVANLEMRFKRKPTTAYTDLKKRGLCLVPLSVFANYLP